MSQSWNIDIKSQGKNLIFKSKADLDYEYVVEKPKKKEKFLCSCSYYLTIGLLCFHMFAFAMSFTEQTDLPKSVRKRWMKSNSFEKLQEESLMEIITESFMNKDMVSKYTVVYILFLRR